MSLDSDTVVTIADIEAARFLSCSFIPYGLNEESEKNLMKLYSDFDLRKLSNGSKQMSLTIENFSSNYSQNI